MPLLSSTKSIIVPKTHVDIGSSSLLILLSCSSIASVPPKSCHLFLNSSSNHSNTQLTILIPHAGNPVNCYYCPNCTAHIYHHQTVLGDKLVVRTSLLQGTKDFKVAAEIFGKDRLKWQPEIAQTFEGPPPS